MNLIACTMEDNEPVGKVLRARWRLDPGEARAFSFVVVAGRKPRGGAPMHAVNEIEFEGVELDRLHEVAVYEEFCLARDTPPERTMEFEQRSLLLGWSRMRGGVAYLLDDDEEWRLDHYDPFATDRVFRGAEGIRFAFASLEGRADLVAVAGGVRVDWELRNASSSSLVFGIVEGDDAEGSGWALSRDRERDRRASGLETPRPHDRFAHRAFDGDFPTREAWPPGSVRRGSFVVPDVTLDRAGQWSAMIPVAWPSASGPAVPTTWCIYWHGRYGADVAVVCPFRPSGEQWSPFERRRSPWRSPGTASFSLAEHAAVLRSAGGTQVVLDVIFQGDGPLYAMPRAHLLEGYGTGTRVWLQRPGEEERSPAFPEIADEPRALEPTEADSRFRVEPGARMRVEFAGERRMATFTELRAWQHRVEEHPWAYLLPISLPRATPPIHTRDFPLGWLEVRFAPGEGLSGALR